VPSENIVKKVKL